VNLKRRNAGTSDAQINESSSSSCQDTILKWPFWSFSCWGYNVIQSPHVSWLIAHILAQHMPRWSRGCPDWTMLMSSPSLPIHVCLKMEIPCDTVKLDFDMEKMSG
jgi:hypothetical protein